MKIELKSVEKSTLKVNAIKETKDLVTIEFLKNKRLVKKLLKDYTPRQVIYVLESMYKAELQAIGHKLLIEDIDLNNIDFDNIDLEKYNVITGDPENYKYYNFVLDLTGYDLGWDAAESVSVSNIITYKTV